jgi:F420-dependent oxidoreductase-like protein
VKLGLQIPAFDFPGGPATIGPTLARIARVADDVGFDSIWVMDHFFQIPGVGDVHEPMLEAYTTLGFLAAATERLRLGTLVTGVTYRPPAVLIKEVTTLDVLSGGRANFGIGAAWFEREHVGLGIPFPPLAERFERLEETLRIANHMWRGDTSPFHGRYYQLDEPLNSPPPLSRPHPPIMIGGAGERKTLRLVARYADASNFFARMPREELVHKLDVLRRYCAEEGRDFDAIDRTVMVAVDDDTDTKALVNQLKELSDLGFTTGIASIRASDPLEAIDLVGRYVVPEVRAFGAGGRPRSAAA